MNEILNHYLQQIVQMLLLALAGWLGVQVKNLYKKYITTKIKQNVCKSAVRFVEQVYQDLHGPEKLFKAMQRASEILETNYGITISETELVTMLEAAVNEFNNAFHKTASGTGKHETGAPAIAPADEDPEPTPTPTMEEIIADLKDAE